MVPPEINLRGHLAVEAYNKALNEGKTCVKRVPVMLIGQERSGKTSLKKSLTGKLFKPDEDSTVGIDVDPAYFKVSTEVWKTGEKDQATNAEAAISYEHYAARLVVENLKQEECLPEERVVEHMQPGGFSHVDAVSSRSEFSEVSSFSGEPSTSNHYSSESSADFTEDAQYSEMARGFREYFQTLVAKPARGVSLLSKFGNLSIREILVVMSAYARPSVQILWEWWGGGVNPKTTRRGWRMPSFLGGKSHGAFGQPAVFLAGNRTTIVAFEKGVSLKSLRRNPLGN